MANRGPHGLPLIGRADWNDCLNLNCFSTEPGESFQTTENQAGGTAESVFIAAMFAAIGPEYAAIAERRGLADVAARARAAVDNMREAVMAHGWDGEWFLRAYDFYGQPVGTDAHDEGKIWIEPQGMAIMGGIGLTATDPADPAHASSPAVRALDSVSELLGTDHGLVLQYPAYTSYRIELGEVSTYPPGYKENGGIFCHNNPWVIIAETMVGRGERAFDYYRRITPAYREDISEIHRLEPYVYAQMIAGKQAPRHGEAKNSWLTGTAAWNFVTVSQYLLGVRPDYDGLVIDPQIGPDVPSWEVTRVARGATYRISVTNSGAPGARASLVVDGRADRGQQGSLRPRRRGRGGAGDAVRRRDQAGGARGPSASPMASARASGSSSISRCAPSMSTTHAPGPSSSARWPSSLNHRRRRRGTGPGQRAAPTIRIGTSGSGWSSARTSSSDAWSPMLSSSSIEAC